VLIVKYPATDQVNYGLILTHSGTANKRMLDMSFSKYEWANPVSTHTIIQWVPEILLLS